MTFRSLSDRLDRLMPRRGPPRIVLVESREDSATLHRRMTPDEERNTLVIVTGNPRFALDAQGRRIPGEWAPMPADPLEAR